MFVVNAVAVTSVVPLLRFVIDVHGPIGLIGRVLMPPSGVCCDHYQRNVTSVPHFAAYHQYYLAGGTVGAGVAVRGVERDGFDIAVSVAPELRDSWMQINEGVSLRSALSRDTELWTREQGYVPLVPRVLGVE